MLKFKSLSMNWII